MTIQEIASEIKEVESKISKLEFDENGNACGDRHYANALFERAEELNEMLFGKSLNVVK